MRTNWDLFAMQVQDRGERAQSAGFRDPDVMDAFEHNRPACSSGKDWGAYMEMKEQGYSDTN